MKDISIEDPSPEPTLFDRDINQSRPPTLRQGLSIGFNESVILIDGDQLEQHDPCAGSFSGSQTLLIGTNWC